MEIELQKKIDRALRLLDSAQKAAGDKQIEISYSGGKDSDVILELARMAGINARPIYKNTTIDPPGTIAHSKSKGVEVIRPQMDFRHIIQQKGFPTFHRRFCCEILKEYKILDFSVQGIRRCESKKREKLYKEPQICRIYSKEERVSVFLPILEWTDSDVSQFIREKQIQCHPLYYNEQGKFCVNRRLGCLGCPLPSDRSIDDFKTYPKLVNMWLSNGQIWWDKHNFKKLKNKFNNIYELFVSNLFFRSTDDFKMAQTDMFGQVDCKQFLCDYFKINL